MVNRKTWTLVACLVWWSPASAQMVPRFGVRIPMRDGVQLVGNLFLPDSVGHHPTILLRTPYDKTPQFGRYKLANYVKRGYAVMVQDVRGRGDSDGLFNFYFSEGKDGYDTIEWIARQPWSNGRVAMDGGSYLGTVQWLAARERPPHLACIAPDASSGRLFDEIPYQGGAFRSGWALEWLDGTADRVSQSGLDDLVDWEHLATHRPLRTMDDASGRRIRLYREFLDHPTLDSYWATLNFTEPDFLKIDLPVLTVTGWFDGDQPGALSYWDGANRWSPAKDRHHLIIGPWTHPQTYLGGETKLGEFQFSAESVLDIQGIRLGFFDACLKRASSAFAGPRVRAFVTGINEWRSLDQYPAVDVQYRNLYLHSGGTANSVNGNGTLSWTAPTSEPPDHFVFDPKKPVPERSPTLDHRALEAREDILVYTSEELSEPVEILGRVFVEVRAASDALDTDFTAKLLDVYPDGRAVLLGPEPAGVRRARYRKGYTATQLLTPNQPEEFRVELFDMGHRFLSGHKIRVEISSSVYPHVNPNQNTGNPVATDTVWRVARQTIFHQADRPSRVILPVMPIRP